MSQKKLVSTFFVVENSRHFFHQNAKISPEGGTFFKDVFERAMLEIQSGQSLRSTAAKYGMSEGGFRYCLKQKEKGEVNVKIGRPTPLMPN